MKLTISGSQCTGKSTLIKDLFEVDAIKERFNLQNETTRNIWHGVFGMPQLPINELGTDATQELICAQHLLNHTKGRFKDTIYDRCALDGLVYTTYLYNNNKVSRETLRIAEALFDNLKYDIMLYIPPEVALENDGERSTNTQFRDDICQIFNDYIESYNLQIGILTGSREERVEKIQITIKAYDEHQAKLKAAEDAAFEELNHVLEDVSKSIAGELKNAKH